MHTPGKQGKPTPGPWAYEDPAQGNPYIEQHFPDRQFVIGPSGEAPIAEAKSEANARLIAAAPDMYALLNELMDTELSADTLRVLQPWMRRVELVIGRVEPAIAEAKS